MTHILVNGAGGFIGGHLVRFLKDAGHWVRGVDLKNHEFMEVTADEFIIGDLRDANFVREATEGIDVVYQLAADMGGAGYIFTGENDTSIMHNSAMINLNTLQMAVKNKVKKVFYSSSACVYPEHNQLDPDNPNCEENSAYPAAPDSEYGWEKLFSERLYFSYSRNYNIETCVSRFHNIFGPRGTWNGGKEKVPAATCRKIAEVKDGDEIEVWGDGLQTRSFLFIDECLEGISRLMASSFQGPINIGSDEMVSINQLVDIVAEIAGKRIKVKHIPGPLGVRGRTSDNCLIAKELGWKPSLPLCKGLEMTYAWIEQQVNKGVMV